MSAGYPGHDDALHAISLTARAGRLTAVLGPNGAGKSTLLRVVAGLLEAQSGTVEVLGDAVGNLDRAEVARRVALVHQAAPVAMGYTVREVVAMGRAPHQGSWMRATERDREAVDAAVDACELGDLVERSVEHLSGGEQQRVMLARALAQRATVLLLDEAAAHLDVRGALRSFDLVRREVRTRELVCLAVMHDLHLAARYADDVLLLKAGRAVAEGPAEQVLSAARLSEVFDADIAVGTDGTSGERYYLPLAPR